MTPVDDRAGRAALVAAYFDYQRTKDEGLAWAWDAVDAEGWHDPDEKWALILELVAAAPDDWNLGLVAAGPLEDFLRMFGRTYAATIESEARTNAKLRIAISITWVDATSVDPALQQLVQEDLLSGGDRPSE